MRINNFKFCFDLTLKIPGGGDLHPQVTIRPITPFLGIGAGPLIYLNSGMSIPVVLPPFEVPRMAGQMLTPLESSWTAKKNKNFDTFLPF